MSREATANSQEIMETDSKEIRISFVNLNGTPLDNPSLEKKDLAEVIRED